MPYTSVQPINRPRCTIYSNSYSNRSGKGVTIEANRHIGKMSSVQARFGQRGVPEASLQVEESETFLTAMNLNTWQCWAGNDEVFMVFMTLSHNTDNSWSSLLCRPRRTGAGEISTTQPNDWHHGEIIKWWCVSQPWLWQFWWHQRMDLCLVNVNMFITCL